MNLDMYDNIIVNKALVRLLGSENAVYWTELMFILQRVYDKRTYNENGYFPVNREYIQDEVGLSFVQQYNCDSVLKNINVLEYDPNNRDLIRISPAMMNQIIIDEEGKFKEKVPELVKLDAEVKKINREVALKLEREVKAVKREEQKEIKAQQRQTKNQVIISNFQRIVREQMNVPENLLELYYGWIESVYARGLFLTKIVIKMFIDEMNYYTTEEEIQRELLEIAVKTGYRDFSYVRNYFENNNNRVNKCLSPQNQVSVPQPKADVNSNNKISF